VSETLNTVILGIVEGITEFLPISSTGHLLITEQFLGARSELFNVAIQAGAILAIVLIYRQRLTELLLHSRQPQNRDYLYKLTVSVLITLVLGFAATKLGFKLPVTIVRIDSRVNLTLPLNSCVSKGDLIGYQAVVSEPDEDGALTPPRLEPAPVTAPSDGKLVQLDAAGSAFGLVSGGAHACD